MHQEHDLNIQLDGKGPSKANHRTRAKGELARNSETEIEARNTGAAQRKRADDRNEGLGNQKAQRANR